MFLPVKGFGSGSRCLDGEVREAKPEKDEKSVSLDFIPQLHTVLQLKKHHRLARKRFAIGINIPNVDSLVNTIANHYLFE
jgi:hypothetical protein